MTEYERPNTVSGLMAKRKELTNLIERYRSKIKKLSADVDHLNACIRLFDPEAEIYAIRAEVTTPRAPKGSLKRFVLNTFREATGPMTSEDLTELWIKDCSLDANSNDLTTIKKRIRSAIKTAVKQGLLECVGETAIHGAHVPHKLWTIKRGS
jgi:hypothetical protein